MFAGIIEISFTTPKIIAPKTKAKSISLTIGTCFNFDEINISGILNIAPISTGNIEIKKEQIISQG